MVRPEHLEKELNVQSLEATSLISNNLPVQVLLVRSVTQHQVHFVWIFECEVRVKDLLQVFIDLLVFANWNDVLVWVVIDNFKVL